MSKIKKLLQPRTVLPILLLMILILIPVEHKYDKPLRSTFRALDFSEGFTKSFYFYVTDVLGVCFILLCFFQSGWKKLFWNRSTKFVSGVIVFSLLSIVLCDVSSFPMQWIKWIYFCIPLLFFSSVQSIEWKPEVWIPRIFWAILFVALFECCVGLYQYITQHALGLKLLGEPKLNGNDLATIPASSGQWIFEAMRHQGDVLRAYGTFPHPNVLGGFLVFSLMTSYYLWFRCENKGLRTFVLFSIFIQILGLISSFSRSAIIGWAIASILWIVCLRKEKRARFLSLALLGFFFLCVIAFYPQLKSRGGIINYNQVTKIADSERITFQNLALKMIQRHPLKGIGYANMGQRNDEFLEGDYPSRYLHAGVHNIYLYLAAEIGLLGLLAYLCFLFSISRALFRSKMCPLRITIFSLFVGFLFIGGCDFYLLQFQQGKWMFIAVAVWIASLGNYERDPALKAVKVASQSS